jgi:tetratricopeptide (TPR) repeat protein
VLLEKGEVDESLLRFAQALGYRGVLAEARVGLGSAAIRKGWPIMAIYQFRKALALKPSLAVAHNNLSFTYFLLGDFALAVMHCDKAIKGGYPVPEQLTKSLERYRAGSVLINYLSQYQ